MKWFDREPGRFQRADDAPVGRARVQRGGALNADGRLRSQSLLQLAVEARRIELAQRIVGRIGKIDDSDIEQRTGFVQPNESILVNDCYAWIIERMLIQFREPGELLRQAGHL